MQTPNMLSETQKVIRAYNDKESLIYNSKKEIRHLEINRKCTKFIHRKLNIPEI